jgi:hypothetical protein
MKEGKYGYDDCFVMAYCGGIAVASALIAVLFGFGYDLLGFGLAWCLVMMFIAGLAFVTAYKVYAVIKGEKDRVKARHEVVIKVERHYTRVFKMIG